ncbi:VanZ family protein [Paenibacillus macerans]|uniref:VanZ family protein n=1 Tax=Paenibacillus macerans TaxID=44252 RepID=UPI003D30F8AF
MKTKSWLNYASVRVLFALYLWLLVKIILFKFHDVGLGFLWRQLQYSLHNPGMVYWRLQEGNLVPMKEIARSFEMMTGHELINLVGNVAIFLPFGVLLGIMFQKEGISGIETFIYALAVSMGLECAQLLFAIGQFDVDDLLLNASGACLGYMLYRIYAIPFRPQTAFRAGDGAA